MKSVHLVEAFGGGVAHGIKSICDASVDRYTSTVIHGVRDFNSDLQRAMSSVAFRSWNVSRSISPKEDWRAYVELKKILTELAPDIVHAHSSKAGVIGRLACRSLGIPVIYSPHSFGFLRKDVSGFHRALYFFVEKVMAASATTVACGIEEYRIARRLGGRVSVVDNTFDASIYKPGLLSFNDLGGRPLVIGVGRICPQKDFDFFCRISRSKRLENFRFLWVSGHEVEGDFVGKGNVEVLGRRSPVEMADLYRSASVFLNTSLWEGLSKAVIEACAMGLPLVLRNVPGNRELPFRGCSAKLFSTEEECIRAIVEMSSHELREEVFDNNSSLALRYFGNTANSWVSIYDAERFAY